MSEDFRVFQNRSEMGVIFVHSELDDRGLSHAEFRVYCHLARRAGTGIAYPGVDSIAKKCCMSKGTAIAAIKALEGFKMISADRKTGQTTRYILTAKSEWTPLPKMNPPATSTNEGTHQSIQGNATSTNEGTHQSIQGNATSTNEGTKGNPTKVIQEGNPSRFKKPTIEEVKLAAAKAGLSEIEADKFFNHYESNGWRVGRNPMRSMPHAITNWRLNIHDYTRPTSTQNHHQPANRNNGTLNNPSDYAGITHTP